MIHEFTKAVTYMLAAFGLLFLAECMGAEFGKTRVEVFGDPVSMQIAADMHDAAADPVIQSRKKK